MQKYPELYQHLAQVVHKHVSVPDPLILDIGTGPGLLSAQIHKVLPTATILGLDPAKAMLILAQQNTDGKSFETIRGVSECIPLATNTIDLAVSRFSLPYWKQPQKSFSEIYRILKPKGCLVLEALNKDFPGWRLFCIKMHMLINFAGAEVIRYHIDAFQTAYTIDQVERFLIHAKFHIIEKKINSKDWKFLLVAEK